MIGAGRPLRFLALLLGCWIAMRVVLMWPTAEAIVEVVRQQVRGGPPIAVAAAMPLDRLKVARVSLRLPAATDRVTMAIRTAPRGPVIAPAPRRAPVDPDRVALALLGMVHFTGPPSQAVLLSGGPVGRAPTPSTPRWTVSAWLVARGEGAATLAPGGTLGGSQAGIRAAFRPFATQPIALFARASRPLHARGAEAAVGVEVQPFARIPVRATIEQRVAIEDGAAEGTALSLVGGIDDVGLAGGFRLNGYGQAGIIGLRRRAGFVDGAASVTRPVASRGDSELLLGAAMWGAAQPDLSRLDIGPRAELRLPIAGERVRLGVEWRERVAGNARPGSGPALTIGADF
jgi:hypothetical protein